MQFFDDSFRERRWEGGDALPLHWAGYDTRIQQLKAELSQVERPVVTTMRKPRALRSPIAQHRRWTNYSSEQSHSASSV